MQEAYDAGLVVQTAPGRVPRLKRYLDEQRGKPLGDVWSDISPLNARAAERLGYPTQKPLKLLSTHHRSGEPSRRHSAGPVCRLWHDNRCSTKP